MAGIGICVGVGTISSVRLSIIFVAVVPTTTLSRHRRCRHDRLLQEQQVGEELYLRQYGVDISISHIVCHDTTSLNATTQRLSCAPSDGTALP